MADVNSADFTTIRMELAGLRKRAVDMQNGATKGVEISDSAGYMVYAIDRLKMLIDEAEQKAVPRTK
jgi:hypothetical protein